MKFCYATKPLYLETDTIWVELCVGLLQVRKRMNCMQDEAPEIDIPCSTVIASKGQYSGEKGIAK